MLVKCPFIGGIECCGPGVADACSECSAFWTRVFGACGEFRNKVELTDAGEVLSEPVCFGQGIGVGSTFLVHGHWIDGGVCCALFE